MRNKLIYAIMCGAMLFSTTACDKEFLEIVPEDQPTVDGFYNSAAEIRAVTATLYGRPWFEYNDKFSWAAGDGMAGDLYNDYQTEGQLFFLTYNDDNNIISQGWRGLYNVIAFANSVINDMPRVAGESGVSQEVINAGVAEARFIRAFAYYILAEYWEDVPIVESAADLIAGNNIDIPKSTYQSVYNFIIRDLQFAAEHLPVVDEPGRVTRWAAKGMLAKVHLTRAQREDSTEDFAKAAAYAKDVIENSGLVLLDDYADLFKIENNNNPETLFALQWIGGTWGLGNSRQAVMGRSSIITGNSEAWGGGKGVTIDFMDNVEENAEGLEDKRQPSIYMTLGDFYPEINKDEGGYTYNIVTVNPEGGDDLEFASSLLNNIKKYVVGSTEDVGVAINNQGVPLNQYMLRLADVYLIYAEAILGMAETTSDPTALMYFNAVRERAGLAPRTVLTYRDIFNERRVEFGMEGINWFDIKRYYYHNEAEALQYLNDQNRASTFEAIDGIEGEARNAWEAFEIVPAETPVVVTEADLVLPIPSGEVSQNPNLAPGAEAVEYTFE